MQEQTETRPSARVIGVSYTGGIIGIFYDRHIALQRAIAAQHEKGWRLTHVLPSKSGAFANIVQLLCLALTLGLWAPEPGETLVFEPGK